MADPDFRWEFGDILALFTPGFRTIGAFVWNLILTSLILMVAGAKAARARDASTGAWLVIAPWIVGSPDIAAGLWNVLRVGAIVFILGTRVAG